MVSESAEKWNENTLIVKRISEGPLFRNENSSADEVEVLVTNGW